MGALIRNPSRRSYDLDGETIPSVHTVLTACGLLDSRWYNEDACERGLLVAELTALDDAGVLDEESVDDELRPWLETWRRHRDECLGIGDGEQRPEVRIESPIACPLLGLAGTPDRIVGDRIVELKTGEPEPWHLLQVAAYCLILERSVSRASARIVYLCPDERPRVRDPDREELYQAKALVRAAAALFQWRRRHGAVEDATWM